MANGKENGIVFGYLHRILDLFSIPISDDSPLSCDPGEHILVF